jgi:hypothetical protein
MKIGKEFSKTKKGVEHEQTTSSLDCEYMYV